MRLNGITGGILGVATLGAMTAIIRRAPLSFTPAVYTLMSTDRFDREDDHFNDTIELLMDSEEDRDLDWRFGRFE